jgi:hypothetical protein
MSRPSRRQGKIRTPAVIGAIIDLGNCLDLLDSQYFEVVHGAHQVLQQTAELSGLPMPKNQPFGKSPDPLLTLRNLDCKVINAIHDQRRVQNLRPFDTVRAGFFEGEPLYDGASFYDRNHIQICVRNTQCIKGYFRLLP